MRERAHITVSGHVQGVFFRQSTDKVARSLSLDGWVRNLPDGDVEILAEGETDRLLDLLKWARKGPPSAYVADTRVQFSPAQGDLLGFRIRYD